MGSDFFSRYRNCEVIETNGQTGYGRRGCEAIQTYPDQLEHTIIGNETLDMLAAKYYGRASLWWRIADANPGRFPLEPLHPQDQRGRPLPAHEGAQPQSAFYHRHAKGSHGKRTAAGIARRGYGQKAGRKRDRVNPPDSGSGQYPLLNRLP